MQKNKINQNFGFLFLILGITLIINSLNNFFTYNFTTVLFVFMRSNSSIIAEFIFGIVLSWSGILILSKNRFWLKLIKILAIAIVVNTVFNLLLMILPLKFNSSLIFKITIGILICFGTIRLTKYLCKINDSTWSLKNQKMNCFIGISVGLFPFLFQNVFF